MPLYEFETTWCIRAPQADAWAAIVDSERWPEWWRGVERVVLLRAGDERGVGAVRRLTWRSKLPYTLSFDTEVVRVEPMSLIEGRASGELEGVGIWRLDELDGVTRVHYTWRVRTTPVVDEPPGADRAAGFSLEPRLRHAQRRYRAGEAVGGRAGVRVTGAAGCRPWQGGHGASFDKLRTNENGAGAGRTE